MSFEWQTEEEVDWEDPDQPQKEPEQKRRRLPWSVLVLLALSLTAVSILIYEVSQRVSSATETVEDELLASVRVIQNAAVDGDRTLFSAFISGRDKEWARATEMLVADELYLQRPAFSLDWIEVEPEAAVISTTLSPDLRSAEVLLKYDYELDVGNGLTDTIELRQTAVYRLGENKWLLAPPEDEYWGEEKTIEAGALTIIYPERDEVIVRKLAADWSAAWVGMCALFGNLCDRDFRRRIELSTNPASLKGDPGALEERAFVQLPAPSLVGIPTDRDGYGALYRGYLAQILRPFWQQFLSMECCDNVLLYNEAVRQLWQEMSGWPVGDTAVNWQTLQQSKITLHNANRLWGTPDPTEENIQLATAIVTFLVNEANVSTVDIMQSLTETQESNLTAHLIAYFNEAWTAELWERAWRQFVYEKAGNTISPEQLPQQDLLMLCRSDWGSKIALYRHDLQQNSTTLVQDFNYQYNDGFIIALPDDSGIVMRGVNSAAQTVHPFLLRDNVRYDVLPDRETTLFPLAINQSGDYVLWYQLGDPPADGKVFAILELAACLEENACQVEMSDLYPIWSPDGSRLIVTRSLTPFPTGLTGDGLLTQHSPDGNVFLRGLGVGSAPVWLGANRYGFAQRTDDGRSQFWAAEISPRTEPELLLSADELAQALPDEDVPVFIDFAFLDPHDATRLLLMAELGNLEQFERVLFAYDLETGDMETSWSLGEALRQPGMYNLSPNGEWLLTSSTVPGDYPITNLYLHHLQSGETLTLPMGAESVTPNLLYTDWAADGDWLSYPQNGMIELVAPAIGKTHLVVADELYCTGAVWTNE